MHNSITQDLYENQGYKLVKHFFRTRSKGGIEYESQNLIFHL